jgi:hypothetical protein
VYKLGATFRDGAYKDLSDTGARQHVRAGALPAGQQGPVTAAAVRPAAAAPPIAPATATPPAATESGATPPVASKPSISTPTSAVTFRDGAYKDLSDDAWHGGPL